MWGRLSITVFTSAALVAAGTATAGSSPPPSTTEWIVRPGPGQVALLHAGPGTDIELVGGDGSVVRDDDVDLLGSVLFRSVEPGEYTLRSGDRSSEPFAVPGFDEVPEQEFYASQDIQPGYGYLTARDGTTLSINV